MAEKETFIGVNSTEISINDVIFVRKDSIQQQEAESLDGMPYVIIRTYSAGVFAGYLESREGKEGVIRKSRRIWYWDGAASLSQLAMEGTNAPANCKFACVVEKMEITEIIEVLHATEAARCNIEGVQIWKK